MRVLTIMVALALGWGWSGPAAADDISLTLTTVESARDNTFNNFVINSSSYGLLIEGIDANAAPRRVGITVQTEPVFTTPEAMDGWRRTVNKCRQTAARMIAKPGKFVLDIRAIGSTEPVVGDVVFIADGEPSVAGEFFEQV